MNFYIGLLLVIIGTYFCITDTILVNKIITAIIVSFNYIIGVYLLLHDNTTLKENNQI